MSDDLVKYRLPADFITARAWPRPGELAYGWRSGWIDSAALAAIAQQELSAGLPLPPPLESLGLLTRDRYIEIPEFAGSLTEVDSVDARRLWLYLALAWLFTHRQKFDDPLETIELLYTDFDCPEEIEGLVRFIPVSPGTPTGVPAIIDRWRAYLAACEQEYSHREWLPT